ncbi:hypothetical protein HMPREF0322_00987 [Desulfitobacterium hafniense DP7]|uniref:Uncharacterized protein n=1 Tax=Desulfitobacterium hafniense DP7 TaxID=537010 RepID=G9XJ61_DESHA|nr:hypothetical protein HMPREF0322_00987 [Desulfitobacterium hafniense DP7]
MADYYVTRIMLGAIAMFMHGWCLTSWNCLQAIICGIYMLPKGTA